MAENARPPGPPAAFNLAHHVFHFRARPPDKIALNIATSNRCIQTRYDDLERMVLGVAAGLKSHGLRPGAYVLLRLGNTIHFPIAYLGAIAGGFIPVVTSSALTQGECTSVAKLTSPVAIVAGPGIALPETQDALLIRQGDLENWFEMPGADYVMGVPDRPAYVVMTSGTQGAPRAVLHAHRAIWARQMMWDDWEGLTSEDRLMHAGAFNWTYTLGTGLLDPWTIGATAIVPDAQARPLDLPDIARAQGATIFAAAPGIFRKLLRADGDFGPGLRHALSAGEKLPERTRALWRKKTGTDIHEAFGMSECSTFISGAPRRPATGTALGWPQSGRKIALLSDGGKPVAEGDVGQIAIHAGDPGLMLKYLGAARATRDRFTAGYFLTGDLARMDDAGAIHYMGRADDMLNAGGFRVSPVEVEQAMGMLGTIVDCAAIEVPVAVDTTIIALYYTGEKADEAVLQAHAERHLARYKQPRRYVHMPDLPRGPNNKVSRRRLRAEAAHDEVGHVQSET